MGNRGQTTTPPICAKCQVKGCEMMGTGKNNTSKTRNWAFLVYPESAPEDWKNLLADTHIPAFISPIHDRDVDEDGVIKKAHYHIVIMNDGPITQKRANEIIEPFCGTKSAEYVMSLRGYVRYLSHMDDPDKAQYDSSEIIALSGADLGDALKLSHSDKYKVVKDILSFCGENGIYEFSALTGYAMSEHEDWMPLIVEKAYFISQFLTSLRHSTHQ